MKIIRPVTITNTVLDSSNLAENDYAAWSGATTYALGDRVILTSKHRIYESAINSNLNNNPALNDPTKWINVGATNKWKPFDGVIADQATNTTTITYSLIPSSLVNAIAFFNLNATTLNVTVDDPTDGIVYDEDFPLVDNGAVENWFSYFFEPIVRKSELIALDLPNYASATIDITITGDTGGPLVGAAFIFTVGITGPPVSPVKELKTVESCADTVNVLERTSPVTTTVVKSPTILMVPVV